MGARLPAFAVKVPKRKNGWKLPFRDYSGLKKSFRLRTCIIVERKLYLQNTQGTREFLKTTEKALAGISTWYVGFFPGIWRVWISGLKRLGS